MVAAPPFYTAVLADAIAALQGTVVTTVGGQAVPLDTQPGSFSLGVATAIALTQTAFYGRQTDVQNALTLATAQGSDLDALVALVGVTRNQAAPAQVPVLFMRQTPTTDAIPIPVGITIVAADASNRPTITFETVQGSGVAPGLAAVIPANGGSAWALATADDAGTSGNVGTNTVRLGAESIAGVDSVSNPSASTPNTPTATVNGASGSTTYQYVIVGHGVTGTTLPSATTTVTTGNATLSTGNSITLDWTPGTDGGGVPSTSYDVLRAAGSGWDWIATTTATTYTDTGTTPLATAYALPTVNTSNQGVGGVDVESDAALRARAPLSLAQRATSTAAALIAAAETIPNVAAAYYADSATPGAGTLSIVAVTYPLSPDESTQLVTAVQNTKAAGAKITVTTAVPTPVNVAYTAIADPSVQAPTSLEAPVLSALQVYFGSLGPQAPVRFSAVIAAMMSVQGIEGVSALSLTVEGGSTYTGTDTPNATGVYSLGTVTPTGI